MFTKYMKSMRTVLGISIMVFCSMMMAGETEAIQQSPVDIQQDMQQMKLMHDQSNLFQHFSTAEKISTDQHKIRPQTRKISLPDLSMGWTDRSGNSREENRSVFYGSGRIANHPDSLYFNFATGMNGSDTLGMDIILSGNEGANFGSDSWLGTAFANPSPLFYLSPDSSMDMVSSVPDTGTGTWTDISWDWQGGNGGQPVEPGNLWVVFTHTTHHYVLVEITGSAGLDWNNPWIEFNYAYQDDGSTDFEGSGGTTTDGIDVLINGMDDAIILQGEPFTITVDFPDGVYEADAEMWIDMDGDGILDPAMDFNLEEYHSIVDNGMDDENPAMGIYEEYIDDSDGPHMVSNLTLFYKAIEDSSSDVASLHIDPMESPFSFSGQVDPPMANIIIISFPMEGDDEESDEWMTVTDASGNFQNFVPDSGLWSLMAFDYINVTGGMVPDTSYFDIPVVDHLMGFDFYFYLPTSGVEGLVLDEMGTPIPDVEVHVKDEPYFSDTDEDGYFFIGLEEGTWDLGLHDWDLLPDFLVPQGITVDVFEDDTLWVEFMAYSTDNLIAGTVYLDGTPWGGVDMNGWSEIGWTSTMVNYNGYFELPVSSMADQFGGYHIGIDWDDLPPNIVVDSDPNPVFSGNMNADIYLSTVAGGIEGMVFDAATMDPLPIAWVNAHNNMDGFGTGTWEDGSYYLPLPNGEYTVNVGAEGYYLQTFEHVVIQNNTLQMDFYLDQFAVDGMVFGYIYDQNGSPLADAQVQVGNDSFWNEMWTGPDGYYEFDLPNGMYGLHVWKDGYIQGMELIDINNNNIQMDFYLQEIVTNAGIEGFVYDGETGTPIIGADVYAFGHFYEGYASTTTDGYFFMNVPSDTFHVIAHAPGFGNSQYEMVYVDEYDTASVVLEIYQPMHNPQIMAIFDVRNDQGKQVHVAWHPADTPGDMPWTEFSIWRLLQGDDFMLWEYITTVPYHGMEPYSVVAPTLIDSNHITGPDESYWSIFRVTAHTFNPWEFYDSEPFAGYSIDNLHPMPPVGLMADVQPGNGEVILSWRPALEEDFHHFSLYRSVDNGAFTELGMTGDTIFVDANVTVGHAYSYMVTTSDFNGNESDPSEVSTEILSIIIGAEIPDSYALSQNYPNPFNPTTELRYDLPEDGFVSVIVYNTLGREVDQLIHEHQPAGKYKVVWNADSHPSGVYFIRMMTDTYSETRKMMLIK